MALEAKNDAKKNKKNGDDLTAALKKGEAWIIGINGFALLASIGIGIIYIFQLHEMRKSTTAATRAAYAACVGAQISRSALLEEQAGSIDTHSLAIGSIAQAAAVTRAEAAQIKITFNLAAPIRPDMKTAAVITVENIGKTAAHDVKIQREFHLMDTGIQPDFHYSGNRLNIDRIGSIFPNDPHKIFSAVTKPGVAIPTTLADFEASISTLSESDYKRYVSGDAYFASYGRITYKDIFGTSHWVQWCDHVDYLGKIESRESIANHKKCGAYNSTDNQSLVSNQSSTPVPPITLPPEVDCLKPENE
jgi:hypothetical protein